jgi:hypothetical protein
MTSDSKLDINDFKLERTVCEVRYSPSFLYWDRMGKIWTELNKKWPSLKLEKQEQSGATFTFENKFEVKIKLDRASIIAYRPQQTLKDVIEKVTEFVEILNSLLEIDIYLRVGLRIFYFKEFDSKESATRAVLSSNIVNIESDKHFGINGEFLLPEYAVRWKGKSTGVTVRVRAEGRVFDISPGISIEHFTPVHKEQEGIVVDVDYYNEGVISVSQFRAEDWISQALHLVRRDIHAFLWRAK